MRKKDGLYSTVGEPRNRALFRATSGGRARRARRALVRASRTLRDVDFGPEFSILRGGIPSLSKFVKTELVLSFL